MKDDGLYLLHILDCIERIQSYTIEGESAFFGDRKTQDAVIRNLQVLSESVRRLSPDLTAARPEVEWRSIAAFRNVAVHDYLGVDLKLVWQIVERDLPGLRGIIREIVDEDG